MPDDIVDRLRTIIATPHGVDIWTTTALEAADEIERLRAEVDAVKQMHDRFRHADTSGTICRGCGKRWPCPTINAQHDRRG